MAGSVSTQLQLPALPSAPGDALATAKREAWLRRVLAAARAVEAEQGPWWGCRDVAAKLGRPLRHVAPAVMALLRRGALMRSEVGEDACGRTVFAWTASKSPRSAFPEMELERILEMLARADR